jgi:hypothetical protein
LCKKQGEAAYNTPKWWDPLSDPTNVGVLVHWAAPFILIYEKATSIGYIYVAQVHHHLISAHASDI